MEGSGLRAFVHPAVGRPAHQLAPGEDGGAVGEQDAAVGEAHDAVGEAVGALGHLLGPRRHAEALDAGREAAAGHLGNEAEAALHHSTTRGLTASDKMSGVRWCWFF